ncbi:39S ribosomal protein L35, mitochondrial [Tachyglossus aculeatus]|uniref:39S ribosomal protein L35, mitochondrial n=1 Tax=Tachyglossus aculeatus TaxID=9261 RepID=UPI0018F5ED4B|nr:39S ribosomal protein L35, mitochondrial [Tachyglossus aculeatus]
MAGRALVAKAVVVAAGVLRPLRFGAPLMCRSPLGNIRLASAASPQPFHPIRVPNVFAASKPLPAGRTLTCGSPAAILKSVAPVLPSLQPVRTLTYCSLKKGKRKSVKPVIYRFLRLHSGLWLRRRAGYKKKLWKKKPVRRKRLRELVFCSKTQSRLLDKMTTSFWKRRNWYVDDPYQRYQNRTNLKV